MLNDLIKNAIKSKNKIELRAYQNLKTELQKVLTSKNAPKYSNDLLLKITSKYCKSLEDAIKQFSEAHRDDLVQEYTNELEVLKKLLPEPVNESQIYNFIETDKNFITKYVVGIFDERGDFSHMELQISKKEIGNVIKFIKSKFPTADGKMIFDIVGKYVV